MLHGVGAVQFVGPGSSNPQIWWKENLARLKNQHTSIDKNLGEIESKYKNTNEAIPKILG